MITCVAPGSADHDAMIALRIRVLRAPLGLAYTDEQLAAERNHLHLALWQGGIVAGTLLIVRPDSAGTARLRQMAIEPGLQGSGLGRLLVGHAEQLLPGLGASAIMLAARASAIGFYEKLGYVARGERFVEVTLPHQMMVKRL